MQHPAFCQIRPGFWSRLSSLPDQSLLPRRPENASYAPRIEPIPFRNCSPWAGRPICGAGQKKETVMGYSNAIAKAVSVATLGLFATVMLVMALAPNPSLFAG